MGPWIALIREVAGNRGILAGASCSLSLPRRNYTGYNEPATERCDMNVKEIKKSLNSLKTQFEENPTLVIGVASGAVLATAKLITAVSETRNNKTWRQEVQRRQMKDATRRPR